MTGFGFAGHVIGGVVGGTVEGTAHAFGQLGRYVSPRLAGLVDGISEKAMIKYQAALDRLTPDKIW